MSGDYQRAIREAIPDAQICFDPFHVVRLGARATDEVRRDEWNRHDRSHTPEGRWVKGTRWSLLKAPEHQTIGQLATLAEVQLENRRLYRAFLLSAREARNPLAERVSVAMELGGLEPPTSWVRSRRSPN
jgi:transposase